MNNLYVIYLYNKSVKYKLSLIFLMISFKLIISESIMDQIVLLEHTLDQHQRKMESCKEEERNIKHMLEINMDSLICNKISLKKIRIYKYKHHKLEWYKHNKSVREYLLKTRDILLKEQLKILKVKNLLLERHYFIQCKLLSTYQLMNMTE